RSSDPTGVSCHGRPCCLTAGLSLEPAGKTKLSYLKVLKSLDGQRLDDGAGGLAGIVSGLDDEHVGPGKGRGVAAIGLGDGEEGGASGAVDQPGAHEMAAGAVGGRRAGEGEAPARWLGVTQKGAQRRLDE